MIMREAGGVEVYDGGLYLGIQRLGSADAVQMRRLKVVVV